MDDTLQQQMINQVYAFAIHLLSVEKCTDGQACESLVQRFDLEPDIAAIIVAESRKLLRKEKKRRAGKNMLYGSLWCAGGIIATMMDWGFIFWGAILFGGIQFFNGLLNYGDAPAFSTGNNTYDDD